MKLVLEIENYKFSHLEEMAFTPILGDSLYPIIFGVCVPFSITKIQNGLIFARTTAAEAAKIINLIKNLPASSTPFFYQINAWLITKAEQN